MRGFCVGSLFFYAVLFLVIISAVWTSLEKQLDLSCFSRAFRTSILLRNHIATCDFQEGGGSGQPAPLWIRPCSYFFVPTCDKIQHPVLLCGLVITGSRVAVSTEITFFLIPDKYHMPKAIRTASANSEETDLGCTSRVYFHNVTLTSQKPCQYNNKFNCSETNGHNLPQEAIQVFFHYSDILMEKNHHKLHLFCRQTSTGIKHVFLCINIFWTPPGWGLGWGGWV